MGKSTPSLLSLQCVQLLSFRKPPELKFSYGNGRSLPKVSLQVTVEAVIGGSAVLPCSSTEHDYKLQDINVFWRHSGGKIVYDIIPSGHSQEKQDPDYKNRIETFPDEYERGNFSIKLNNLAYADAGKYICYITHSSEQPTVQLIINESTAEKGSTSTDQENQGETEPGSEVTSSPWIIVFSVLTAVIVIVMVMGIGFIVYLRKKSSNSLSAGGHSMGSDTHEVEHMNDNNDKANGTVHDSTV